MSTLRITFLLTILTHAIFCTGQTGDLYFSLQQMPDLSWGVYVKPGDSVFPTERTSTGTGQVTIVAPLGFEYTDIQHHGGSWMENARVDAPEEASDKTYISFGFVNDSPKLQLYPNEETLLFTFRSDMGFEMPLSLFENETDPFATPNSLDTNPGNEIGILDLGTKKGMQTYRYAGNYQAEKLQAMAVMMMDDDND